MKKEYIDLLCQLYAEDLSVTTDELLEAIEIVINKEIDKSLPKAWDEIGIRCEFFMKVIADIKKRSWDDFDKEQLERSVVNF